MTAYPNAGYVPPRPDKPIIESTCPECGSVIKVFRRSVGYSWRKRIRGQIMQHQQRAHGYIGRAASLKADEIYKDIRWLDSEAAGR